MHPFKKLQKWLNIDPRVAGSSALIFTLVGLLNFGAIYSFNRSYDLGIHIPSRLFDELTGTWSLLLLMPFLLRLFKDWPLTKGNRAFRLLGYFGAMLLMGVLHTCIMTAIRYPMYQIFQFGYYDPGNWFFRMVMETAKASPFFWTLWVGYIAYTKNKEKERQTRLLLSLQKEKAEAELTALRNQINPHFLFNSLNMISSVMYEDIRKADTLIANLSDFLRAHLKMDNQQVVSLAKEWDICQLYVSIMQTRFGEQLRIETDFEPESLSCHVPLLSLQPLVENAIKFTTSSNVSIAEVTVLSRLDQDMLIIEVHDNGPGIGANSDSTREGIRNLEKRLSALFGETAQFELESRNPRGATSRLIIPCA